MEIETLGSLNPEKMEEEKQLPKKKIIKRKKTTENQEEEKKIERKITIEKGVLTYGPITDSTPYRNINDKLVLHISLQPEVKVPVCDRRNFYDRQEIDFLFEYEKLMYFIENVLGVRKKKEESKHFFLTVKEKKKLRLLDFIRSGSQDYANIAKDLNLKRQTVRNWCLKFKKTGELFKENRGRPKKLNNEHLDFLKHLIEIPANADMTLLDMKLHLMFNFKFRDNIISTRTIYDALKKEGKVFKKIIWKKPKENELKVKEKRKEVAIQILKMHLSEVTPVYIDETSFNLNTRQYYGWGTKGRPLLRICPCKSINFSLLVALDIEGIVGWMLFRGSVKTADFFTFLMEMIEKNDLSRWGEKYPVYFMDNAKIHKANQVMLNIFNKYQTTLYNAPYSPQLNPIEYSFSKLKSIVRKMRVKNQKELVRAIYQGLRRISKENCIYYIIESFKFLKLAYTMEDFI